MEVLKVVGNGLLLSWLPPKRDNGMEIVLYELEIIDFGELQRLGVGEGSLGAGGAPEGKTRQSLEGRSKKGSGMSDEEEGEEGEEERLPKYAASWGKVAMRCSQA